VSARRAARRSRARRWWVFAIIGLVVAAAGVALVVRHDGGAESDSASESSGPSDTSGAPKPALAAADLLLSAGDVGAVMKASMSDEGPAGDLPAIGVTVDPKACTGAFDPFDRITMTQVATPHTSATRNVVESSTANRHVVQSVTIFATSSDAEQFFDRQTTDWKACARRTVTAFFARADKTQRHTFGTPVLNGDLLTLTFGNDQRQCQRAIGMKAHVLVDVRACGPTIRSEAATIATDMLAKAP
jgi:hypothetical protein